MRTSGHSVRFKRWLFYRLVTRYFLSLPNLNYSALQCAIVSGSYVFALLLQASFHAWFDLQPNKPNTQLRQGKHGSFLYVSFNCSIIIMKLIIGLGKHLHCMWGQNPQPKYHNLCPSYHITLENNKCFDYAFIVLTMCLTYLGVQKTTPTNDLPSFKVWCTISSLSV